jgi:hypothetical protein
MGTLIKQEIYELTGKYIKDPVCCLVNRPRKNRETAINLVTKTKSWN